MRGCGLYVTGTDTGVGKTQVAAAIIRRLAVGGCRVAAYKPVASGVDPDGLAYGLAGFFVTFVIANLLVPRERSAPSA